MVRMISETDIGNGSSSVIVALRGEDDFTPHCTDVISEELNQNLLKCHWIPFIVGWIFSDAEGVVGGSADTVLSKYSGLKVRATSSANAGIDTTKERRKAIRDFFIG